MQHRTVEANGARFHVLSTGTGCPLLLLHGWPEYSLTWQPVMERLAGRYELFAPDLRGFGDTDKPSHPFGPDDHAADMVALIDALGIERAGVVAHDVGGPAAMAMARNRPDRLTGLFLFDFVYPGIGARLGEPSRLNEIWYQSFNQMEIAPVLVGASRDTCRAYIGHFLRHWAHRKDAFDDVLEEFVDTYLKPGNLAGGFSHYRGSHKTRIAMMENRAPAQPPITVPTCVRWAEHDALMPFSWTDRLGEYFKNLDLAMFQGVGHFPHREAPDRAAALIGDFFDRRIAS